MAAIPKDLPDLPPLLDQAILDPLLNDEQLHELCDASRQEMFEPSAPACSCYQCCVSG